MANKYLCDPDHPLGWVSDKLGHGTEMEVKLTKEEMASGVASLRCSCCTMWRGFLLGLAIGMTCGLIAASLI